jgi:pilus assembly protein CpaC
MKPGQTLAIAGLIQERVEATKDGFPVLGDLPYINMAFSRKRETVNTVELLVLVRPELVEALDPEEVPPCGPGLSSRTPTDCEFYVRGHIEVPKNHPYPHDHEVHVSDSPVHGEPIPPGHNGARRAPAAPPKAANTPQSGTQVRRTAAPARVAPAAPPRSQPPIAASSSRKNPQNRSVAPERPAQANSDTRSMQAGLIGPVGYDLDK